MKRESSFRPKKIIGTMFGLAVLLGVIMRPIEKRLEEMFLGDPSQPERIFIFLLLYGLVFISAYLIPRLYFRAQAQKTQLLRNTQAREIYSKVMAGEEPEKPYVLYLRPFFTTGTFLTKKRTIRQRIFLSGILPTGISDFEILLNEALEPDFPVIAIGETKGSVGSGKIITEDANWKTTFHRLASLAELIIIVPLNRPGTVYEVETLVKNEHLLRKTAFVMPPASFSMKRKPIRSLWKDLCSALTPKSIAMPPYEHGGSLFTLDPKGNIRKLQREGDFENKYLRSILLGFRNASEIEKFYQACHPSTSAMFPDIFKRLIRLDSSGNTLLVRPPISLHKLADNPEHLTLINNLIDKGFLVRRIVKNPDGINWVGFQVHAALLDWPKLHQWTPEDQRQLTQTPGNVRGLSYRVAAGLGQMGKFIIVFSSLLITVVVLFAVFCRYALHILFHIEAGILQIFFLLSCIGLVMMIVSTQSYGLQNNYSEFANRARKQFIDRVRKVMGILFLGIISWGMLQLAFVWQGQSYGFTFVPMKGAFLLAAGTFAIGAMCLLLEPFQRTKENGN